MTRLAAMAGVLVALVGCWTTCGGGADNCVPAESPAAGTYTDWEDDASVIEVSDGAVSYAFTDADGNRWQATWQRVE